MNCQTDIAVIVRAESKACFGVDGRVANRYGNRQEIALLPIEHLFQFSTLLQSLTGKTEIVEHLPIHLFRVDSGGIFLPRQIVLKGNAHLSQLLFAFGLLTALEHSTQVVHALLHIVCQYLVQSKVSWVIELFEEVSHEVLQKSVLVVELQECRLVGSGSLCCFKVSLVVNTRNYGEFSRFLFVLYLRAVFQDQHIIVIAV